MVTNEDQRESLQNQLKTKQICRFCLSQQVNKLSNIYSRDRRIKSSAPLTVQVMACSSMEVFSNDSMPQSVCIECRVLFEHSYRFKQMCKKAETLLRQVPLTGDWPKELVKPKLPPNFLCKPKVENNTIDMPIVLTDLEPVTVVEPPKPVVKLNIPQQMGSVTIKRTKTVTNGKTAILRKETHDMPKKILNSDPAKSPEPPVPKRAKRENHDYEDDPTTVFLNKVENDEELSIDDLHRLIEANTAEDVTHEFKEKTTGRPKLLNKSSIRILNKEADTVMEPQFSKPELKRDKDGNVAVVTEIIDPSDFKMSARHIKDAKPIETQVYPCPHCERSFPLRQLRDIHVINHTRERSNPCAHCSKSFFSKYDLQKHMITHSGDKPFKCSICDKAFTRATLLHRHEKTHTDVPKFICCHCEKPFISHEEMEKHAERHNKNRPFKCSVCNKSFAFKQGLERHFVVHSNDQPFPCHYCDQTFPTSSKLARHLTAHAGRRPYPCKFCPKSFLLSHHLTRHLRSHKMSASNYVCNSCNTVFTAREDLIRHSAEHTKTSLVCILCREELPSAEHVRAHIQAHVSSESFACEFCDLMFMSAERLHAHASEDHAEDMIAYIEDEKQQNKKPPTKNTSKSTEKAAPKRRKSIKIESEEHAEEKADDEAELYQSINELLLTDTVGIKIEQTQQEEKLDEEEDEEGEFLSGASAQNSVKEEVNQFEENEVRRENQEEDKEFEEEQEDLKVEVKSASMKTRRSGSLKKEENLISPPKRRNVTANKSKADVTIEDDEVIISDDDKPLNDPINDVIKTLPKSVALRRNKNTASKIEKKENPKNKQTKTIRSSNEKSTISPKATKNCTEVTTAEESGNSKRKRTKIVAEILTPEKLEELTSTQSPVTDKRRGSVSKEENILLGNQKVNVQKISLSKWDAATMAKQGRLRIKDGKIVLTRPYVTDTEK